MVLIYLRKSKACNFCIRFVSFHFGFFFSLVDFIFYIQHLRLFRFLMSFKWKLFGIFDTQPSQNPNTYHYFGHKAYCCQSIPYLKKIKLKSHTDSATAEKSITSAFKKLYKRTDKNQNNNWRCMFLMELADKRRKNTTTTTRKKREYWTMYKDKDKAEEMQCRIRHWTLGIGDQTALSAKCTENLKYI